MLKVESTIITHSGKQIKLPVLESGRNLFEVRVSIAPVSNTTGVAIHSQYSGHVGSFHATRTECEDWGLLQPPKEKVKPQPPKLADKILEILEELGVSFDE